MAGHPVADTPLGPLVALVAPVVAAVVAVVAAVVAVVATVMPGDLGRAVGAIDRDRRAAADLRTPGRTGEGHRVLRVGRVGVATVGDGEARLADLLRGLLEGQASHVGD